MCASPSLVCSRGLLSSIAFAKTLEVASQRGPSRRHCWVGGGGMPQEIASAVFDDFGSIAVFSAERDPFRPSYARSASGAK
jgi:hypothetical protein